MNMTEPVRRIFAVAVAMAIGSFGGVIATYSVYVAGMQAFNLSGSALIFFGFAVAECIVAIGSWHFIVFAMKAILRAFGLRLPDLHPQLF